jgi:hypothetical protein
MEFPITKNRLQNITDELNRLSIEKYISEIIEYLTNQIIKEASRQTMLNNKNLHIPINSINVEQPENCRRPMILEYIPKILNKLQERFPDTIICLDPMKTYFFIDWS